MAKFIIVLTDLAKEQLQKHKKSGNKANINKISKIFKDLENNPFVGVRHPIQNNLNIAYLVFGHVK